ncbi:hypothetical protein C1646_768921 [Rhizophagus diaphanus]|nr:hypothetical protein C1646_768921 [Rhizophagus diaphanus] [Rhizophagus sp. MUCL 43196]
MACSKIFSGDIPEVMQNIIENLRDDIKSLYSCILINRNCCFLAIPLLWEDPFSVKYRNNLSHHFIDTYFSFLNENDKNKVNKIKFHKSDIKSLYKPLFNYHTLIKTLDTFRMELHIISWLNTTNNDHGTSNEKTYFQLITSQDESNEEFRLVKANKWNKGIRTICTILFNLFVENNVILNKLHIIIDFSNIQLINSIYELILNNPTFISNIEEFTFHLFNYDEQSNIIEQFLSSLPSNIKHIEFFFKSRNGGEKDIITDLINSQSQLTSIKMRFSYYMLSSSFLDSLKNSSNTLTSLYFGSDFTFDFYDTLSNLTQLESLQFKDCDLDSNIFQSLLEIKTPLKIKTLVIKNIRISKIIEIELFIQKVGYYIKNLVLDIEYIYGNNDHFKERLFDAIINYCEKIQFLHLGHIDYNIIPKLSKIISNFNNTLKFLTLEVKFFHYKHFSYNIGINDDVNELKISSMILKLLCDILPLNLCYLDLNLVINPDDLKLLFDNCDQIDFKRLLIRNRSSHNLDVTLKTTKDFIKNKNLDYLSYSIRDDPKFRNNLELLFKEIQSFVKMKNYYDLAIKLDHNEEAIITSTSNELNKEKKHVEIKDEKEVIGLYGLNIIENVLQPPIQKVEVKTYKVLNLDSSKTLHKYKSDLDRIYGKTVPPHSGEGHFCC